jgi:hypothetical protein
MRFPKRPLLVLIACSLLLAACGKSKAAEEEPADPFADQVTTTTVFDEWAVPQNIDAEYVRRVVQRLDDVRADVRRDVYASHQFTPEDQKKIEAIYYGHQLAEALNEWPTIAPLDHPENVANPGSAEVAVQEVLKTRNDCIWANVTFDESKNRVEPKTPTQGQVVLIVFHHDKSINPTPWLMSFKTIPGQLTKADACG